MPQLLRIQNSVVGRQEFQINLKDNIRLKPNSKIALKNLNFVLDNTITIPAGVTLSYKIQNGNNIITIPGGDYNSNSLIKQLNNSLNSGLVFEIESDGPDAWTNTQDISNFLPENGFSWQCSLKNSKIVIGWIMSEVTVPTFFNNSGDANQWLNFYQSTIPVCPGCFAFQATITSSAIDTSASDFIIGLTNQNQTYNSQNSISPTNMYIGVSVSSNLQSYKIVVNGEIFQDGVNLYDDSAIFPIGQNNKIYFRYNQGSLFIQFFRVSGIIQGSEIIEIPNIDLNMNIYPCYSIRTGNVSFGNFLYTPNMSITQTPEGGLNISSIESQSNNHSLGALNNIDVSITPGAAGVYLGFPSETYEYQSGIKGVYQASQELTSDQLNSSIVVEIPNIPVKAYDSKSGSRRSIVSVVDTLESLPIGGNKKKYSHTEDTLIFLDIDNQNEMIINNLFIRILISGDSEAILSTDALTEMTLVFD